MSDTVDTDRASATYTPESWRPVRNGLTPSLDQLELPPDPAREFDEADQLEFFQRLAEGYGPMEIGLALWGSPAAVNRFMADPDRAEIIDALQDRMHEGMERAIYRAGISGNVAAMKLYAFNKMKHRGWSDSREVQVGVQSQQEIVISVRQAMQESTRELIGSSGEAGVAALQAAFLADDDIIDGEVVDEDVHPG